MTYSVTLRPAQVRVPGSTANLGAGFDSLGLALNRYVTASYRPGTGLLTLHRGGTLTALAVPPEDDTFVRAFRARLAEYGVDDVGGELECASEIPLSRGMGSSAAAVVAALTLADAVAGDMVAPATPGEPAASSRQAGLEWATKWEGHPDNAAPSIFGGLVAVARDEAGRPVAATLPLSDEVGFAFAAPGVKLDTRTSRSALPSDVPHALASRALGRVAALVHGFATGDPELLRVGMTDELHVPYRLPLIPGSEAVLAAAREAGAWAATISGSGTGLIAVCPRDLAPTVAEAMGAAFRARVKESGDVAFPVLPDLDGASVLETAHS